MIYSLLLTFARIFFEAYLPRETWLVDFFVRLFDRELAPAFRVFGLKDAELSVKLTLDTSIDFLVTSFPLIIFSLVALFLDPDLVFPDVVDGANLLTLIGAGIMLGSVYKGII